MAIAPVDSQIYSGLDALREHTGEEMYNIVASELSSRNYDIAIFCVLLFLISNPIKKLLKKIRTMAGKFVCSYLLKKDSRWSERDKQKESLSCGI